MKRIYTFEKLISIHAARLKTPVASASQRTAHVISQKGLLFVASFLLMLLPSLSFSQSCPNNVGFDSASTVGWVCRYGYYGGGTCPVIPQAGVCPTFTTVLNSIGKINAGGNDAALNTGNDRHTIVDNLCYGTGIDPNSIAPWLIQTSPLGAGHYTFRLGDEEEGGTNTTPGYTGTCFGPGCFARAEAIRLTFVVNLNNAGITYNYAVFLMNGGHLPEEQPRFEVLITRPINGVDSLIPCGYYKVVANNSNPYCPGAPPNFHNNNNATGQWQYSDWTPVALDLSAYVGDTISIEFRTSDCFPANNSITTITNAPCITTIQAGDTCWSGPLAQCPDSGQCSNTHICTNAPGAHSAYAYLYASCGPSPLLGYNPHICVGPSVTIHAPTGYATYSWSTGYTATNDSIVIANPVVGTTYTVNMESVTNCPSITTITLHGTDATVRDTAFCAGAAGMDTLYLIPQTSQPPLFQWDAPGNPHFSSIQNPVIPIPAITTTYTITVTDTSTSCSVVKTETIIINPKPTITMSPVSVSICPGETTVINATAGGGAYLWSTVPPSTDSTISVTPLTTTTYIVTVTNSSGCTDTASSTVTVIPLPPVLPTAVPAAICMGATSQLNTTNVPGALYQWLQSGTGTIVPPTSNNPVVTPSGTETYTVIVTALGCADSGQVTVTVNPNPVIPNILNASICVGTCHTFDGTTDSAAVYSWIPGPMTPTLTACPLTATTQTYMLYVATSFGCLDSTTATLTSISLPIVTVSPPAAICSGDCSPLSASANVGITSCAWTGANLNNSANCNPSACPVNAGSNPYLVTLTDVNGCSDTATAYITVNPKPVITVSSIPINLTVCKDSSASLTATGAGAGGSYLWTGAGLSSTSTDTTTASPPNSGLNTYIVVGTDGNNCTDTQTVTINVVSPPTVHVLPEDICTGECAQLYASGGLYYTWSPDPSFASGSLNTPNPSPCPSATTTYTITVSNGGNCPSATDTVTVTVHPIPPIMVGTDTTILAGDTATLTAIGGGITYNWSPETGLNCSTCASVLANPLATTLYYVTTIDQYGCRNIDSVLVTVDDVLTLYVPSAFTPDNRTDLNTMLYAYGIGIYKFEFYIFDRWGNEVFESTSPYIGWDGTYRGQKVQEDVYVYLAKAQSITGKSITKTGPVTVVK